MKTILLATYDISPYRGSEASVSWNYVSFMSKTNRLIVLYGKGKEEIEQWLQENTLPNVRFQNIPLMPTRGKGLMMDISYNLNYKRWHKNAYHEACKIVATENVDIVHYLNPIGFKEPGYLWKIDKPYVWGPIQAVDNRPFALYPALSFRGKVNALVRRVVHNGMFIMMPRLRKVMKRQSKIFAATPKTVYMLKKYYHKESTFLPENGIIQMHRTSAIEYQKGDVLNIIWIGGVMGRKALGILLNALNNVKQDSWKLHVVGDGPLKEGLQQKFSHMNDHIVWYGSVPRTKVLEVLQLAHIHVISSLGEANSTVIWEAMSWAVPTMTLDHCGMGAVVCEKCGIKIPIKSYSQVVDEMARNISNLIDNPDLVKRLSKGVIECAQKFMWSSRIDLFNRTYDELIRNYKGDE